jgi:putative heme-binding domain-containing protein
VRALASEVFPLTAADGSALPGLDQLAALQGSPEAGQGLFRGRGTCAVCHRFDGLGGAIGPDLSVIRDKFGTRELIDAMLNPSAAIAFGYDSWTLHLEDGRVLAGSILADGEQVVVRGLDGQRTVVPAAQISSRRKQTVSTMPQAHTLGLSAQDLADLAAFLDAEPEAEPQFGAAVPLFNGSDLSGWKTQLPAGADPSKVWSVTDGVLHCEGQPIGYLYTEAEYQDFELTLEWRFDPAAGAGNSGVLLRVQEPHKVWPRSIEAQLHSRNAGDIWNIDAVNMVIDADRTNGRRTVKMLPSNEKPLGEWNHYRIRVVGGDLELEVNGEVQNTATWVEIMAGPIALQSEGAVIEFRNIVLRPVLAD